MLMSSFMKSLYLMHLQKNDGPDYGGKILLLLDHFVELLKLNDLANTAIFLGCQTRGLQIQSFVVV